MSNQSDFKTLLSEKINEMRLSFKNNITDTFSELSRDLIGDRHNIKTHRVNLTVDTPINVPFSVRHLAIYNPTVDSWRIAIGSQGGAMIEAAADILCLPYMFLSIPVSSGEILFCNRVAGSGTNSGTCRITLYDTPLSPQVSKIEPNTGSPTAQDVEIVTPASPTVPTQFIKTVAAIATPEALAADGTFFQTMTFGGLKAARTANVGIVYLGIGATNDTQPFAINPNEWLSIVAPVGQKYDANDWYLDVLNAGDGLAVILS